MNSEYSLVFKKLKSLFWYIKKCNFFSDNYYHIPYIGDSPQRMIQGFINLPFVKFFPKENLIVANNPWMNITVKFIELEQGLWLTVNDTRFKADICTYAIYEEQDPEYYSLYYYALKKSIETKSNFIESMGVELICNNWTLHSPKSEVKGYINKGTEATFYNFFFNRKWVCKYVKPSTLNSDVLKNFFESNCESFMCNDFKLNVDNIIGSITKYIENKEKDAFSLLKLKNKATELILCFFNHIENSNKKSSKNMDNMLLNKMEGELDKALKKHFPGYKKIAAVCNCSVPTLKVKAKQYYGKSLAKIHQERRMEIAKQLIEKNDGRYISEIAIELGYDNPAKFTTAFKKHFTYTPSQIYNS